MYFKPILFFMLTIRLDPTLEDRLDQLAKKTGRTKTYYVREAIEEYIKDLEDVYLVEQRLSTPERLYTLEEAKSELGL